MVLYLGGVVPVSLVGSVSAAVTDVPKLVLPAGPVSSLTAAKAYETLEERDAQIRKSKFVCLCVSVSVVSLCVCVCVCVCVRACGHAPLCVSVYANYVCVCNIFTPPTFVMIH